MGKHLILFNVACLLVQCSIASDSTIPKADAEEETCSSPVGCKDTLEVGDGDDPALLQMRTVDASDLKVKKGRDATPAVAEAKPPVVKATKQGTRSPKAGAASKKQCDAVSKVLSGSKGMSRAGQFWSYACTHEQSEIPDLSSGCLYMASNTNMGELLNYVEHPNPAMFAGMFANGFFPAVGGTKCPSELPGKELTSSGGMSVIGCKGGFLGAAGDCIQAVQVGTAGGLRVFMVSGSIGLPEAWARALTEGKPLWSGEPSEKEIEAVAAKAHVKSSGKNRGKREPVVIPVSFFVCDSGSSEPVSKKRIERQIDVLNTAFAGNDVPNKQTYKYQAVNTKISFKLQGDIRKFTDPKCSSCYSNFGFLVDKYTKRKDGKIKILVCDDDTGILGAASYPWSSNRGIFVQGGTLPGGSMKPYNKGDTLTHELGHYLGLPHTFNNGCSSPGDEADDTNYEESPRFGKPKPRPKSCGTGDPTHNFMDYTDDNWMCSFTADQKSNMWKYLNSYNSDLL